MSDTCGAQQLTLDVVPTPSYALERFMVNDGNRLAYEHVLCFPEWPVPLCVITGPAKSGKTHLAEIWADRTGAVRALPSNLENLASRTEEVENDRVPILIEDVDRVDFEETAFFNLLNRSMRETVPLLLTARQDISCWPFQTNDVKSRARLGVRFNLRVADDLELSQMFAKQFDDRQVIVDPAIISYLVLRMIRSPAEVYELAALMDELALRRGKAISRKVAADALEMRRKVLEIEEKGAGQSDAFSGSGAQNMDGEQ